MRFAHTNLNSFFTNEARFLLVLLRWHCQCESLISSDITFEGEVL